MEYNIIRDKKQLLILKMENSSAGAVVFVTLVYAKYNQNEMLVLLGSLGEMGSLIQNPWLVGKDFSVISSGEEKLSGLLVTIEKTHDFNHCMNICNLEENTFKGSKYTWWNERIDEYFILKMLDRVLVNNKLLDFFYHRSKAYGE